MDYGELTVSNIKDSSCGFKVDRLDSKRPYDKMSRKA